MTENPQTSAKIFLAAPHTRPREILFTGLTGRGDECPADVEANGVPNFTDCDSYLIFNGFRRNLKDFRDLPAFHFVFFYQLKDQPAAGGELRDRVIDKDHHVGGDQQLLGIGVVADQFRAKVLDIGIRLVSLLSQIVEGDVLRCYVKIDFEIIDGLEGRSFLPDLNKDVRYDLLRQLLGFHKAPGKIIEVFVKGDV